MNCFIITHSGTTYHYVEYHHLSMSHEEAILQFRIDFPVAYIHHVCIRLIIENLNTNGL